MAVLTKVREELAGQVDRIYEDGDVEYENALSSETLSGGLHKREWSAQREGMVGVCMNQKRTW